MLFIYHRHGYAKIFIPCPPVIHYFLYYRKMRNRKLSISTNKFEIMVYIGMSNIDKFGKDSEREGFEPPVNKKPT